MINAGYQQSGSNNAMTHQQQQQQQHHQPPQQHSIVINSLPAAAAGTYPTEANIAVTTTSLLHPTHTPLTVGINCIRQYETAGQPPHFFTETMAGVQKLPQLTSTAATSTTTTAAALKPLDSVTQSNANNTTLYNFQPFQQHNEMTAPPGGQKAYPFALVKTASPDSSYTGPVGSSNNNNSTAAYYLPPSVNNLLPSQTGATPPTTTTTSSTSTLPYGDHGGHQQHHSGLRIISSTPIGAGAVPPTPGFQHQPLFAGSGGGDLSHVGSSAAAAAAAAEAQQQFSLLLAQQGYALNTATAGHALAVPDSHQLRHQHALHLPAVGLQAPSMTTILPPQGQPATAAAHQQQQQNLYLPVDGLPASLLPTTDCVGRPGAAGPSLPGGGGVGTAATSSKASTLVLDRINICISNHYLDSLPLPAGRGTPPPPQTPSTAATHQAATSSDAAATVAGNAISSTTMAHVPAAPLLLNSPIIPAIQHRSKSPTDMDLMLGLMPSSGMPQPDSQQSSTVAGDDEPDSTTATPPQQQQPSQSSLDGTPPRPLTPSTPPSMSSASPMITPSSLGAATANRRHRPLEEASSSSSSSSSGSPTTTSTMLLMVPLPVETQTEESSRCETGSAATEKAVNCEVEQQEATPPHPPPRPLKAFKNGEDVLIKRLDGCFYLGTVIDSCWSKSASGIDEHKQIEKFLVLFDDRSEQWCLVHEMRKLGGGGGGGDATSAADQVGGCHGDSTAATASSIPPTKNGLVSVGEAALAAAEPRQMCVACKGRQPKDIVEICERCGRGYHRRCTRETQAGSGEWLCKRCDKPMKIPAIDEDEAAAQELLGSHSVGANAKTEGQHFNATTCAANMINCYCGKLFRKKTDQLNCVQCCKCQYWFHMRCLPQIPVMPLRGDNFFVFCCASCHRYKDDPGKQRRRFGCTPLLSAAAGQSFLCRLQMTWPDVLQLALYNLARRPPTSQSQINGHRFHHLTKEIVPFLLEHRQALAIPKEWLLRISELVWLDRLRRIFREHTDRFVICPEKSRRDHHSVFALRHCEPPVAPELPLKAICVKLSRHVLEHEMHMKLLPLPPSEHNPLSTQNVTTTTAAGLAGSSRVAAKDVYEFRVEDDETTDDNNNADVDDEDEDEDDDDDDDDDEVPIKRIIEKSRRNSAAGVNHCPDKKSPAKAIEIDGGVVKQRKDLSTAVGAGGGGVAGQVPPLATATNAAEGDKLAIAATTSPTPTVESLQGPYQGPAVKNSRKRKGFTPARSYKPGDGIQTGSATHSSLVAAADPAQQKQVRFCDSSSDENSSSSRGTSSLDLIIPPPKNFLGPNNPFRMITPKKTLAAQGGQHNVMGSSARGGGCGAIVKKSIFTTSAFNFSTKLAALKKAGIFPHDMSTSELLAKAAGQPRTVRTIKRRLSAKDITIGPNQEVRRRRTRRFSTNVEVISTTTINPIPSSFFPIHAKDLFSLKASFNYHHQNYHIQHQRQQQHHQPAYTHSLPKALLPPALLAAAMPVVGLQQPDATTNTTAAAATQRAQSPLAIAAAATTKGRRLRQRLPPLPISATFSAATYRKRQASPPTSNKNNNNDRRTSISSLCSATHSSNSNASAASSSSSSLSSSTSASASANDADNNNVIMQDLKESVHKYFGAVNRIESGEQFAICAKRQLPNGQTQYLIEWANPSSSGVSGAAGGPPPPAPAIAAAPPLSGLVTANVFGGLEAA